MNISSAVVKVVVEYEEKLKQSLSESGLCEVHMHGNGRIVVSIEGNDVSEEIGKVRAIEKLEHVLAVEIIYSYSENELEKERNKIEMATDCPEWLNEVNVDARKIPYNGDLKKKF